MANLSCAFLSEEIAIMFADSNGLLRVSETMPVMVWAQIALRDKKIKKKDIFKMYFKDLEIFD